MKFGDLLKRMEHTNQFGGYAGWTIEEARSVVSDLGGSIDFLDSQLKIIEISKKREFDFIVMYIITLMLAREEKK